MFKVFKKGISSNHSHRDYNDMFSSKYDVLVPIETPEAVDTKTPKHSSIQLAGSKSNPGSPFLPDPTKLNLSKSDKIEFEDIDEIDGTYRKRHYEFHYHKKTFVFCKSSLYIFDGNSKIRHFAVWLTESLLFEIITMIIIILNSALLGIRDYTERDKANNANIVLDYIEPIFITYYIAEAILKIIARGFAGNTNSYLRNGWNWIDLFVAISGLLFFEDTLKHFGVLRAVRILYFLRSFKIFKRINSMLIAVSASFLPLLAITGLLIFFMFFFAIIGINLNTGALDGRCRLTQKPVNGVWQVAPEIIKVCGATFACPGDYICGSCAQYILQNPGSICHEGNETLRPEFNWGLTSFDDIFRSLFTVFIVVNGNWENLLKMLSDSTVNIVNLIYFFVTYVVCKLFIIQLAVAVMLDNFSKSKQKDNLKKSLLIGQGAKIGEVGEKLDSTNVNEVSKLNHEIYNMFESPKKGWREKWKLFCSKYFPTVDVPPSDYYKNPFTYYAYKITSHALFKYITICLIILNLVIIALDRFPIDSSEENLIVKTNNLLTILYIVEVILRIIAQSLYKYLQENFNILEFAIAALSMIQLCDSNGVNAISILRVFRLLKFMRREYSWDNFKVLITVVFEGFTYVIDFTILLGVYMYVFAVLGMKFFAGKLRFDALGQVDLSNGVIPRSNFDTLPEAFTVVFQLIVGEDFLGVVLATIRAAGWVSIIYFLVMVITGKYLLIQFFLAIILGAFEEARDKINYGHLTSKLVINKILRKKRNKQFKSLPSLKAHKSGAEKSLAAMIEKHQAQIKVQAAFNLQEEWARESKGKDELEEMIENHQREEQLVKEDSSRKPLVRKFAAAREISQDFKNSLSISSKKLSRVHPENSDGSRSFLKAINTHNHNILSGCIGINDIKEASLFIFFRNSKFRQFISKIIAHKVWETLILLSIIMSSILLMLDSPLNDPETSQSKAYDLLDKIFTVLFAVEMFFKIISYGFLWNAEDSQKAYIRNPWNMLDCLVVVTSSIDLFTGGDISLKSLKSLRALRALRPLRVISRNEDLKLVVNALFRTIPSLKNLTIVAGLIMIIGATVGTGFFKGKFFACVAPLKNSIPIITQQDCIIAGGKWMNQMTNYDDFIQAMLTYFKMITGEGWLNAVYSGVDSVDIGFQPKPWNRPIMLLYFYFFLLVGNVLIKNLFVGVVIDNFRQMKEELGGFLLLNDMQRDWAEMQIFMQRKKLKRVIPEPDNKIRRICYQIVQDDRFQKLIVLLIVINTIILGFTFKGQSLEFANVIDILNKVLLAIFHVEAILGIVGLGIFYFKEAWNTFDLFILAIADVVLFLIYIDESLNFATIPIVIRSLRLGRMVQFIRNSKNIRVLVDTLYFLMPALANIGLLLLLMIFIYAVLGMNLFAGIALQTHINEYTNFQNLIGAFNVLIRCSLGQDWHLFMAELADPAIPGCQDNQSFQDMEQNGILGCGTWLAYPYFISYVIVVTLILMNLFLAIVVGGYAESKKENEAIISPSQMDELLDKWAEYDPQGTGLLTPEQFAFLIHDLPQPLGQKDSNSIKYEYDLTAKKNKGYLISENKKIVLKKLQLFRDMERFNIPVYSNKIHFSDACQIISYNAVLRTYKNGFKGEKAGEKFGLISGVDGKLEEKVEEALREKLILMTIELNPNMLTKLLQGDGLINIALVMKKLQKEAKHSNPKGLPTIDVTSFYAGRYIYEFWRKWKEDKRLYELQQAEKKGIDYDRTFEYQQRLANAQITKPTATMKKGKATRLFDKKKSKRTQQLSMVSVPATNKEIKIISRNGEEGGSKQSSLLNVESPQGPAKSGCSFSSLGDAEAYPTTKGHLEKLIEYKNNAKNLLKRRGSAMSNFAQQIKSFHNNDFWLQNANTASNEKFPVPVIIEIDKFMVNYLDQPELFTETSPGERVNSSETKSHQSLANQSRDTKLPSMKELGINMKEKSIQIKDYQGYDAPPVVSQIQIIQNEKEDKVARLEIKLPLDEEKEPAPVENVQRKTQHPFENNFIKTVEDSENRLREKSSEPVKADLETIEEKHEEYNESNTKADLDRTEPTREGSFKIEIKPAKNSSSLQRRLESIEENALRTNSIDRVPENPNNISAKSSNKSLKQSDESHINE